MVSPARAGSGDVRAAQRSGCNTVGGSGGARVAGMEVDGKCGTRYSAPLLPASQSFQ